MQWKVIESKKDLYVSTSNEQIIKISKKWYFMLNQINECIASPIKNSGGVINWCISVDWNGVFFNVCCIWCITCFMCNKFVPIICHTDWIIFDVSFIKCSTFIYDPIMFQVTFLYLSLSCLLSNMGSIDGTCMKPLFALYYSKSCSSRYFYEFIPFLSI